MNFNKINKPILITLISLMLFALNASAQNDSVRATEINLMPLRDFADYFIDKQEKEIIDI